MKVLLTGNILVRFEALLSFSKDLRICINFSESRPPKSSNHTGLKMADIQVLSVRPNVTVCLHVTVH